MKRELHVPSWLVRHLLGPRGAFALELQHAHPNTSVRHVLPAAAVDETHAQNAASAALQTALVEVEGPPEHVEAAMRALEQRLADLQRSHAVRVLHIDQRFVKHIVGRSGANGIFALCSALNCIVQTQRPYGSARLNGME